MRFFKVLASFAFGASVCLAADGDYQWGNVRFDGGGFVSAVLFHPNAPGILYARTDVGGIYRYDFESQTWHPLMDFVDENDKGLYGTEAFAVDPQDPTRIYVLAGTGYFSDGRTAVFRSQDYGATWDTTYVEMLAHGNGMGRQTGEKLAVDPNIGNIILCGSRTKGLYKSEDYGATWNSLYKVALSDASGNALSNVNGISFVMFDASQGTLSDGSTKTIYIGISETKDNLQVSHDGGKTWDVVEGGPANLMPHRAKIADGNMYITYADGPGPHSVTSGAVYKYNIAAGTWTDITPSDTTEASDGSKSYQKDYSSYGGITIDPTDVNHMVVSTVGKYTGRHVTKDEKDNYGDRIYVTTDGGKTWKHGQHYGDIPNIDANGTNWIPGNAIHWAGSVEFNPGNPKEVWVTSGNGIFQTDDITASVPLWKFQSKGVEETVPLDIVSIPGGPLVTAIGDYDGGVYTDINAPVNRHTPTVGTTQSMGYAPLTGSLVRTGIVTVYGQYESNNYRKMYRSDDLGKTWTDLKVDETLKGDKGLVVLSADGEVMLHRPDQGATVYRSADNGASWKEVSTGNSTNYARIIADQVNADVFYVMSEQADFMKSSNKGLTFEKVSTVKDEQNGKYYNGSGLIRAVPGKEGHVWVPMDQAQVWLTKGFSENGLAYTEDGGATWNRCEGASTAIAVGIGKAKDSTSYETIFIWGAAKSGDPIGIYRSTDKCKTFVRVNEDKHQFGGPGNGNFVQGDMNHFGVVYMSTVGRGTIVGAPEGTVLSLPTINFERSSLAAIQLQARNLYVNAPSNSKLFLFGINGKMALQASVGNNSNVSLSKLPVGRWFAKIIGANGKILLNKAIILR